MISRRCLSLLILLIVVSSTSLFSGCSRIVWRPDLGGAYDLAARENRIIIVAYWSSFNSDCSTMESEVFTSGDVYDTMAGTVPVRLDSLTNKKWAEQVGVSVVPSFVAIAPDGRILRRHEGYMKEPAFRAFVVAAKMAK